MSYLHNSFQNLQHSLTKWLSQAKYIELDYPIHKVLQFLLYIGLQILDTSFETIKKRIFSSLLCISMDWTRYKKVVCKNMLIQKKVCAQSSEFYASYSKVKSCLKNATPLNRRCSLLNITRKSFPMKPFTEKLLSFFFI